MKKLFAVLFVAAVMVAGVFADGGSFPSGSWVDENWNGEWVIGIDGSIELKSSVSGKSICKFDKDKMVDYAADVSKDGAYISFYYPATGRAYKFLKDLTASADLILTVNPDWDETDYQVVIKFKNPLKDLF